MDEDTYRYIQQLEKRLDGLREQGEKAITLAHADLSKRLEGFPQLFATKEEMKAISDIVSKLDKETVSRELYDQRHTALANIVQNIDRTKLNESVYATFIENYRIDQEASATERRSVATALATATAREVGEKTGVSASAGLLIAGLGVLGGIITIGLIVANLVS